MPFTAAHPAIVLPFVRMSPRLVSATGLVAGSMAPDFEYFLKMSVSSTHSHTVAGVLYFDLPVSLVLAVVFHQVAKVNLINSLPRMFRLRMTDTLQLDFIRYVKQHPVVFCFSAIIGSLSHMFWDSFTHSNGYFVRTIGYATGYHVPFDGVNYPLWYALQHISTAAGLLAILLFVLMKTPQKVDAAPINRLIYWATVITIMVVVAALRFAVKPYDYHIGNVVVSTITGILAGVIVAGRIRFGNARIK